MTDPSSCERLAVAAWERFGGVHVLCNNAGVIGRFAPVWDQDPEDWDWLFSVNVLGVANMLRAFVPRLLDQGAAAHIVNTASEAAFTARAFVGVYHASKHAVLALTEALAQELEEEGAPVRVSVLCPGGVNTRVLDAARTGLTIWRRSGKSPAPLRRYAPAMAGNCPGRWRRRTSPPRSSTGYATSGSTSSPTPR